MKEQVLRVGRVELIVRDSLRGSDGFLNHADPLLRQVLEQLQKFVMQQALYVGKYELITLSLSFCGRYKIRSLNRVFREKDKITDVLSFPLFDDLRHPAEYLPPLIELGDIFICREVAINQAREYGLTLEQEVIRQFIHGILHLLGYDHEVSIQEQEIMFKLQDELYDLMAEHNRWE